MAGDVGSRASVPVIARALDVQGSGLGFWSLVVVHLLTLLIGRAKVILEAGERREGHELRRALGAGLRQARSARTAQRLGLGAMAFGVVVAILHGALQPAGFFPVG